MSFEILSEKICEKNNATVMGLDPRLEYVPAVLREQALREYGDGFRGAGEAIFAFNRALIDAVADLIPAVKPQSAFYEMYGLEGERALARTVEYARAAGLYVILDVKRNDIGSTAEAYATAYLGKTQLFDNYESALSTDSITVNPYLGSDGILPFVKVAATQERSLFILVKTSNPSSSELQDLDVGGVPLYRRVGEMVEGWGADYIGASGYSPCGAVVGATHPAELSELRRAMQHTFFLIPGYGAQGGGAADVAAAFDRRGGGAIVNSSRGLMCAYRGKGDDANFAAYTREAVLEMRDAINGVRGK